MRYSMWIRRSEFIVTFCLLLGRSALQTCYLNKQIVIRKTKVGSYNAFIYESKENLDMKLCKLNRLHIFTKFFTFLNLV